MSGGVDSSVAAALLSEAGFEVVGVWMRLHDVADTYSELKKSCCSTGSACTTGAPEPSHVLTAMGYPEEEARGAVRLSLGRTTTDGEVSAACSLVPATLARLRAASAVLAADPLGQEALA